MSPIKDLLLKQRFDLRHTRYLCERFAKSPNITEVCTVADHLTICHAKGDASVVPLVRDLLLATYGYVKNWFGYRGDLAVQLWMAPETADLQYMTCLPCDDGFASAPGNRDGMNIIILVSPLSGGRNADHERFSALLAHEITHHFVTDISRSTVFAMKRRQRRDVPMWLEEGLGMVIMAGVLPSLGVRLAEDVAKITEWYHLEDLWNDLSGCDDADRAYLQAYLEAGRLVEAMGRSGVVRLLYLNRTHRVNWNGLARGRRLSTRARYRKERQP